MTLMQLFYPVIDVVTLLVLVVIMIDLARFGRAWNAWQNNLERTKADIDVFEKKLTDWHERYKEWEQRYDLNRELVDSMRAELHAFNERWDKK